jgi:anti-sigma regulatory factor (Ser/Thr protein kinase)
MINYRNTGSVKAGLFAFGVAIVVGLLWYSQRLVSDLQNSERRLLDTYARLIAVAASSEGSESISFIFDEVIQQIHFPVVVTSSNDEPASWRNVAVDSTLSDDEVSAYLKVLIKRMDATHRPIEVHYGDVVLSRIHYGNSSIVSRLRWLPFIEITVAGLFILMGFIGFTIIRNSEKRSIWVGLARETAHQLGTPVSSLMGWIQLLRDKIPDNLNLLDELESDARRLEQIADRFHKIGTLPKFESIDLYLLTERSADYFRQRLPKRSETEIRVIGKSQFADGAETLLQWALENLIKNALDACQTVDGIIEVVIGTENSGGKSYHYLQVTDNGSGINPRDRRNIFRPGYSTKRHGWGLGLSLTRRIVEEIHDGRLRLVSSKPGKTVIRIHLPSQG